jgi:hypothetical protein
MVGNPDLIRDYARIHESSVYGASSVKNRRFLRPEIKLRRPTSILDYGCGQSPLIDRLDLGYPVELYRYDPAIPAYAEKPEMEVDLLINIDVLEHIEESDLDNVIAEMRSFCRDAIIIVDTAPAKGFLPDGRNLHVTLKPHAWWQKKLELHFGPLEPVRTVRRARAGFKTWTRRPSQTVWYDLMRVIEDAAHYATWLRGKKDEISSTIRTDSQKV